MGAEAYLSPTDPTIQPIQMLVGTATYLARSLPSPGSRRAGTFTSLIMFKESQLKIYSILFNLHSNTESIIVIINLFIFQVEKQKPEK